MTETLTTAGLFAALPAGGVGVIALLTATSTTHRLRGAALAAASWLVLGAYMALIFAT